MRQTRCTWDVGSHASFSKYWAASPLLFFWSHPCLCPTLQEHPDVIADEADVFEGDGEISKYCAESDVENGASYLFDHSVNVGMAARKGKQKRMYVCMHAYLSICLHIGLYWKI